MRIKYSGKDPRAGQIVELEEGLARRKIEAGEATEVTGAAAKTEGDRLNDAQRKHAEEAGNVARSGSTSTASVTSDTTTAKRAAAPAKAGRQAKKSTR